MKPSRNVCCLSRTKLRSKGEIQAQCSALNQVSSIAMSDIIDRRAEGWVVPGLLPLRLRAETMLRFHPIAQKQKTDLNIASVLVRAGGPGPGRPLRQSQAGNLVATSIWPGLAGLGWTGLAGLAGLGWAGRHNRTEAGQA